MRRIGITQRVEHIPAIDETRDCLDQRWFPLLYSLGFIAIPLPSTTPSKVPDLLATLSLDAIILSGGNDICKFAPDAPSASPLRDAFEEKLIETAIESSIPILGICRGMQMLNVYFGGGISPIEKHAGTRHEIVKTQYSEGLQFPDEVNSFHNWCIPRKKLGEELLPLVVDDSGNVEAVLLKNRQIGGLMWHPERELKLNAFDAEFMKVILN